MALVPKQEVGENVQVLLKQMKWEIGNDTHILIRDRMAKVIQLRRARAATEMHKKELSRISRHLVRADQDIEREEANLIFHITAEVERQKKLSPVSPDLSTEQTI